MLQRKSLPPKKGQSVNPQPRKPKLIQKLPKKALTKNAQPNKAQDIIYIPMLLMQNHISGEEEI